MIFSDTTNRTGLIQDCETLTGLGDKVISGDDAKLHEFTRMMNIWYRKADTWIWQSVGDWDFDDSKQTTLPIATTTLVTAQADYSVPSTARKIERVEVLDSAGKYQLVTPIDKSQVKDSAMTEYDADVTGLPEEYDMVGGSIYLYPKPVTGKVTMAAGLKLYTSRDIVEFSSTFNATTYAIAPGFDNHFHRICSLGSSYDYCIAKGLEKAPILRAEINQLESEIKTFYGSRHRNFKTAFRVNDVTSF